jgi:hypothetical protein
MVDRPVRDSPVGWVNEHTKRYVESDGKDGHYLHGLPTLLLTTVGRRTGERRRTGATYGTRGADYIVIASARTSDSGADGSVEDEALVVLADRPAPVEEIPDSLFCTAQRPDESRDGCSLTPRH